MQILLDHMVPHEMRHLVEGEVFTVQYMGWSHLQNGKLLEAADEAAFDVLVTHDKGMRHQQDLAQYRVAVLQLDAPSNQMRHLTPLVPEINAALKALRPGDFVVVG